MTDTSSPHNDPGTFEPWLTPAEAAKVARVSQRAIYKAVNHGGLRAARLGGRRELRIYRGWLYTWLEAQAPAPSDR